MSAAAVEISQGVARKLQLAMYAGEALSEIGVDPATVRQEVIVHG
jgi:hypothetical protein